ncbi:hypothetical protein KSP40_PGU005562 [Platanthera guangdongensis]|uniref:NADH-plastoquinone oxidoreductase subunit 5 n=1 Tax=Platanthera guangdongensis TaxID=2320717 RepID=A0ABR2N1G9_9ASPA
MVLPAAFSSVGVNALLPTTYGYSRQNFNNWMPLFSAAISWTTHRRYVTLSGGGLMSRPLHHHLKIIRTPKYNNIKISGNMTTP